jgi:hypothetical protein
MKTQFLLKKYKAKKASTVGRKDKLGNTIEFRLTFEQWCDLWNAADKSPERPWCVCRNNDIGHYEVGNVRIDHNLRNLTESMTDNSDQQQRITDYCISTGYKRSVVRNMMARGKISL